MIQQNVGGRGMLYFCIYSRATNVALRSRCLVKIRRRRKKLRFVVVFGVAMQRKYEGSQQSAIRSLVQTSHVTDGKISHWLASSFPSLVL